MGAVGTGTMLLEREIRLAKTTDKTRTIEAATGQLNEDYTLQVGPWKVGYLAMRNSEVRRLGAIEDRSFGELLDFAYPLFARRFIGDDVPTQEEFEDETSPIDIRVFLAWTNGVPEDEARAAADPLAVATDE